MDEPLVSMNATEVAVNPDWSGAGLLIGQFTLGPRTALLLHNQNWDVTIWPTICFEATAVTEVEPVHGEETAVLDDIPLACSCHSELLKRGAFRGEYTTAAVESEAYPRDRRGPRRLRPIVRCTA